MPRPMTSNQKREKINRLLDEMQTLLKWCIETSLPVDSPEFKQRKQAYDEKKAEVEGLEMELEIDRV